MQQLTLVTVVFEPELGLLHVQARSLHLYFDRSMLYEIIVIDNTARGLDPNQRALLLAQYGHLADLVTIRRALSLTDFSGAAGWHKQQILKLVVSQLVQTEKYVALDAKNVMIAKARSHYFISADGKDCVNSYSFIGHPLEHMLRRTLRYLSLEPGEYVRQFPATVTPFVLDVARAKALINHVESMSGCSFARAFSLERLAEFFLYSGFVIASGSELADVFEFHQSFNPMVWPHGPGQDTMLDAINAAYEDAAPFFSVHRGALAALDAPTQLVLADFWASRGLFGSSAEGQLFIANFKADYPRYERQRKLRAARARLRSVPDLPVQFRKQLDHRTTATSRGRG